MVTGGIESADRPLYDYVQHGHAALGHSAATRVFTLRERARKRVKELHAQGVTQAYLYGDEPTETYSALHSFYLLVDRPAVYGLPDAPFNPWLHMLRDYGRTLASALATIAVILVLLWLQQT